MRRVTVSDACKTKIAELPTSLPAPNYIIFKVSDDAKSIVVADSGKTSTWGDFTAKLPAAECRWALYNFLHGNEKDGFKYSKVFIAWTPDDVKNKVCRHCQLQTNRHDLNCDFKIAQFC